MEKSSSRTSGDGEKWLPYNAEQPPHEVDDYPPEWHCGIIQARIRERANNVCEICGMQFDPFTNKALSRATEDSTPIFGHVHHLDHHPANCDDENLIFLCQTCHIRLHGLGWKPGDELPFSWGNEPPPWILQRNLPYRFNPLVLSLHESARYLTDKQTRAHFILQIIEQQGWITGMYNPLAEMRAFLKTVLSEYEVILNERAGEANRPLIKAAHVWAEERGFVPYTQALALSGLSALDFEMALQYEFIQPEACPYDDPAIPAYFDPKQIILSAETKQSLWTQIRLTRQQAADALGVSVSIFERMRRKAGIKPVGTTPSESGRYEPLYRKRDVESLRG